MNNDFNLQAFEELVSTGLIPPIGNFNITEELLRNLSLKYHIVANKMPKYNSMSRRNSGVALLNLKIKRNIPSASINEGLIYLISNPAWPDYVKIGMSINLRNRLSTYNTSDPHRSYKIDGFEFVLNRKLTEQNVLNKFNLDMKTGEWVKRSACDIIIHKIREEIDAEFINSIHRDRHNKPIKIGNSVAFRISGAYKSGIVTRYCPKAVIIAHDTGETPIIANQTVVIPSDKCKNWKYLQRVLKPQ